MDVDMSGTASPPIAQHGLGSGPQRGDTRIVMIVYGPGQEKVVSVFAEVLGKPFQSRDSFGDVGPQDHDLVIGIPADRAKIGVALRDQAMVVVINAHCVQLGMPPDKDLSAHCDYEFLYTDTPFSRRDLARFTSHILGQLNHHETLMAKPRTYFISTTFPDVRAALPNLDILTVGADAVEIRVDLLKEPLEDGKFASVPSLSYVGEQVMLLRQRTELPIIFTTRCTRENGRFPMDNPQLYYDYLSARSSGVLSTLMWNCGYQKPSERSFGSSVGTAESCRHSMIFLETSSGPPTTQSTYFENPVSMQISSR